MLNLNDVYKKVEDRWVSRVIFDEVVIMPLCRSEEDIQYIYSISNDTGSKLWQLLDGKHSVGDMQGAIKAEYQGQSEVVEREVLEFIGDLVEVKLIQRVIPQAKKPNEHRASSIEYPDKKKPYKTPEIAKVKMQPEQAVLSCCSNNYEPVKSSSGGYNVCVAESVCTIDPETCLYGSRTYGAGNDSTAS